jgi:hypothetical protein
MNKKKMPAKEVLLKANVSQSLERDVIEKMPSQEILLKDLELQWKDHFHMRDQTWKTLTNTSLFFLGAVGLEIKEIGKSVMIIVYAALILAALFGILVAIQHRIRQGQKFAFIEKYEGLLGLYEIKKTIITQYDSGLGKFLVAGFIVVMECCIFVVAIFLLIRKTRA